MFNNKAKVIKHQRQKLDEPKNILLETDLAKLFAASVQVVFPNGPKERGPTSSNSS